MGKFNEFPANMREITEHEFWDTFYVSPGQPEYRQPIQGRKYHEPLHLFVQPDGSGIGWQQSKGLTVLDAAKPARFFRFAVCEHEFGPSREIGRCASERKCKKCGYREVMDSSD